MLKRILFSPFYFLCILLALLIPELFVDLGNWALAELGLQSRLGEAGRDSTGVEGLLEKRALVQSEFVRAEDSSAYVGRVLVGAESWQAELVIGSPIPSVGDTVLVKEVEGLKVFVDYSSV